MKSFRNRFKYLLLLCAGACAIAAMPAVSRADSAPVGMDSNNAQQPLASPADTKHQLMATYQGIVSKVSDDGFTIALAHDGRAIDLTTDKSTRFILISATTMDSLEVGDPLAIQGYVGQETGSIAARSIMRMASVGKQSKREAFAGGNINGIVSSLSPLAIQTLDNRTLSLKAAPDAQVLSAKNCSFSDLSVGSHVVISAEIASLPSGGVNATPNADPAHAQSIEILQANTTIANAVLDAFIALNPEGSVNTFNNDGVPVAAFASLRASVPSPTTESEDDSEGDTQRSDRPAGILPPRQPVPSSETNTDDQPDPPGDANLQSKDNS